MITLANKQVYDTDRVKKGVLIYAKHRTWESGVAGYVTKVTEEEITVQYLPGIGNVTNHFFIPVSEVIDGEWAIRWSYDLTEVYTEGAEYET